MKVPSRLAKLLKEWADREGVTAEEVLEDAIRRKVSVVQKKELVVFQEQQLAVDIMRRPPFWGPRIRDTQRAQLERLAQLRADLWAMPAGEGYYDSDTIIWNKMYNRVLDAELSLGLTPTVVPGVPVPKRILKYRKANKLCIRCGNPRLETPSYCAACVDRIRKGENE